MKSHSRLAGRLALGLTLSLSLAPLAHAVDLLVFKMSFDGTAQQSIQDVTRMNNVAVVLDGVRVGSAPMTWQLNDDQGRLLREGQVPDPRILRGPLVDGQGHATVMQPSGVYFLRVPVDAQATELTLTSLHPQAAVASGAARDAARSQVITSTPTLVTQRFDVRSWMRP